MAGLYLVLNCNRIGTRRMKSNVQHINYEADELVEVVHRKHQQVLSSSKTSFVFLLFNPITSLFSKALNVIY